jgi:Fe-S-cluster-containing hydrogenase component 2
VMELASMCALGKTAVNPVLASMKYFGDEWTQHVVDKICQAKRCKALINYKIDPEKCKSCFQCATNCPTSAIIAEKNQPVQINLEKCIKCGICLDVCKFDAVTKVSRTSPGQIPVVDEGG